VLTRCHVLLCFDPFFKKIISENYYSILIAHGIYKVLKLVQLISFLFHLNINRMNVVTDYVGSQLFPSLMFIDETGRASYNSIDNKTCDMSDLF